MQTNRVARYYESAAPVKPAAPKPVVDLLPPVEIPDAKYICDISTPNGVIEQEISITSKYTLMTCAWAFEPGCCRIIVGDIAIVLRATGGDA